MVRSMLNDCEGVPPWWVLSLLRLCQEDDASLLIDTLIELYFGAVNLRYINIKVSFTA